MLTDSSTLVKFYSKEAGWEAAEQKLALSVTIPLALVELGSAFLKKYRKNEFSTSDARQLIEDCSKRIILMDQNKYVANAFRIAAASNISLYDSLFIAVAIGEKQDLLSSDKKQLKVAASLGVKVVEG